MSFEIDDNNFREIEKKLQIFKDNRLAKKEKERSNKVVQCYNKIYSYCGNLYYILEPTSRYTQANYVEYFILNEKGLIREKNLYIYSYFLDRMEEADKDDLKVISFIKMIKIMTKLFKTSNSD